MIQHWLAKILLFPLSLLYGLGVLIHTGLYKLGILKAMSFDVPVITVGNLSVGGAGKSPHIEYLVSSLQPYIRLATLSRGYRRKSRGFMVVEPQMNAELAGDEPLQFKRKFPSLLVAVAEDRALAIPNLMVEQPETQLILLDDAFQHRAVKAGLNILLTEFDSPFTRDWLLPAGRLREFPAAAQRADIIIVTKCPPVVSAAERARLLAELKPRPHQKVFFSYYQYLRPYFLFDRYTELQLSQELEVLFVSAIARTEYLLAYLNKQVADVRVMEYEDHHYFSRYDIGQIHKAFERMEGASKVIITTEKDATRLELHRNYLRENQLPVFVLPVEVAFHFDQQQEFDAAIRQFLLNFTV